MKKEVFIKISGLHSGEAEDMELMVKGTYMESGDKVYLRYEETDSEGVVYKCRLKLSPDEVIYTKTGMVTTELHYVLHETYESVISTPYGQLDVDIVTERLEYRDTPGMLLDLCLDYALTINDDYASECTLNVTAEEI